MSVVIGIKYKETKARLREKIRDGTIRVLEGDDAISVLESKIGNHVLACYFCGKHIDGKVRLLIKSLTYYPIDTNCYADAKGVYLVNKQ